MIGHAWMTATNDEAQGIQRARVQPECRQRNSASQPTGRGFIIGVTVCATDLRPPLDAPAQFASLGFCPGRCNIDRVHHVGCHRGDTHLIRWTPHETVEWPLAGKLLSVPPGHSDVQGGRARSCNAGLCRTTPVTVHPSHLRGEGPHEYYSGRNRTCRSRDGAFWSSGRRPAHHVGTSDSRQIVRTTEPGREEDFRLASSALDTLNLLRPEYLFQWSEIDPEDSTSTRG